MLIQVSKREKELTIVKYALQILLMAIEQTTEDWTQQDIAIVWGLYTRISKQLERIQRERKSNDAESFN